MTTADDAIVFLDLQDLVSLTRDLGAGPVRDLGLVDAAAARPRTSLFGDDAYPTLHGMLRSSSRT